VLLNEVDEVELVSFKVEEETEEGFSLRKGSLLVLCFSAISDLVGFIFIFWKAFENGVL